MRQIVERGDCMLL